jgi:hypothetical protein
MLTTSSNQGKTCESVYSDYRTAYGFMQDVRRAIVFETYTTKSACFLMDLERYKLASRKSFFKFVGKTRCFRNPNAIALDVRT